MSNDLYTILFTVLFNISVVLHFSIIIMILYYYINFENLFRFHNYEYSYDLSASLLLSDR